jgi:hypothetical protein
LDVDVLLGRARETSSNATDDRPTLLANGHLHHLRATAADKGVNPWNFRVKAMLTIVATFWWMWDTRSANSVYSDATAVFCGDAHLHLYRIVSINGNPDDGEKLAIGDCSGPKWRLDGNGLFPSKADDNQSMHVQCR